MRTLLVAIALLATQMGCSYLIQADAGYAHAFAQAPEHSTATANGYIGVGAGDDHGGAGIGIAARIKGSDAIAQLSLAPFLYGMVGARAPNGDIGPQWAFFGKVGADLITLESVAGDGSVSIGSPFIEVGVYARVYHEWGMTFATSFEDDIRFNDLPNTGYVSFLIGVAVLDYSGPRF